MAAAGSDVASSCQTNLPRLGAGGASRLAATAVGGAFSLAAAARAAGAFLLAPDFFAGGFAFTATPPFFLPLPLADFFGADFDAERPPLPPVLAIAASAMFAVLLREQSHCRSHAAMVHSHLQGRVLGPITIDPPATRASQRAGRDPLLPV